MQGVFAALQQFRGGALENRGRPGLAAGRGVYGEPIERKAVPVQPIPDRVAFAYGRRCLGQ